MPRNDFFQTLDTVDEETVCAVVPLLEQRTVLFKKIWALKAAERSTHNIILLSGSARTIFHLMLFLE